MSPWDREYNAAKKEALGSSTKDKWVPWIIGDIGDQHVEISCVHTSNPHGLISWGWDGTEKIVIFNEDFGPYSDRTLRKSTRKSIHKRMMTVVSELAETLNKQFPKGL